MEYNLFLILRKYRGLSSLELTLCSVCLYMLCDRRFERLPMPCRAIVTFGRGNFIIGRA